MGKFDPRKSLDLIGRSYIWIGTEIETTILFDLARDDETRIALIGNLDEGIGLIILEHDIVFGLVLLDEVDLKKQGLNIDSVTINSKSTISDTSASVLVSWLPLK